MQRKKSRSAYSGIAILELILVLPVLFLTLIAAIQFASVIVVDSTLCHASLEASRLASIGCSDSQIEARVNEFLDIHGMSLASGARVVVEGSSGTLLSSGDPGLSSTTIGTPVDPRCVRTTLLVETDAQPIPNLLRDYCVDFSGKVSEHVSIAMLPQCECP